MECFPSLPIYVPQLLLRVISLSYGTTFNPKIQRRLLHKYEELDTGLGQVHFLKFSIFGLCHFELNKHTMLISSVCEWHVGMLTYFTFSGKCLCYMWEVIFIVLWWWCKMVSTDLYVYFLCFDYLNICYGL